MKKINVALLYDFDKTLCDRDMQEYKFIPDLGMTPKEFWGKTGMISDSCGMERILSYLYLMITESKEKNLKLTREYLNSCGKNIKLYKGVETWFDRINKFGEEIGLNIEHYVLSSGTTEIIEGSSIADKFKKIYGCEFHYDENGIADFPLNTVNYTTKTQYIHRISKGVFDITDDYNLNSKMAQKDRHIQFKNMIYFGDGLTDVPSMKMVHEAGGKAVALYQQGKIDKASDLILEGRSDFLTKADYSEGSELDQIVKLILEKISLENEIDEKYIKMIKRAEKASSNKEE
jgi:hypothetical protein